MALDAAKRQEPVLIKHRKGKDSTAKWRRCEDGYSLNRNRMGHHYFLGLSFCKFILHQHLYSVDLRVGFPSPPFKIRFTFFFTGWMASLTCSRRKMHFALILLPDQSQYLHRMSPPLVVVLPGEDVPVLWTGEEIFVIAGMQVSKNMVHSIVMTAQDDVAIREQDIPTQLRGDDAPDGSCHADRPSARDIPRPAGIEKTGDLLGKQILQVRMERAPSS